MLGGDFQVVDTFERNGAARLLTDLAFTSAPPESQAATLGQSFTLNAQAAGAGTLTYQWLKDGQVIDGATSTTYTIASASAASAGFYACRVMGTAGTITTVPSQVRVRRAARAINVSTRTRVGTGDNVMIGGFVIAGTGTKRVLIKGLGPSLAASVPGTLANPTLQVVNAQQQTLAGDADGNPVVQPPGFLSNDDWRNAQQELIQATNQAPTNDQEAAVVLKLPAGNYTAIVRGLGGAQGVGLVEVYDLEPEATNARLINLSTRSRVQTGDNVMIGGFVVQGEPDQRRRVLVRVLGPSLAVAGVPNLLANPARRRLLRRRGDRLQRRLAGDHRLWQHAGRHPSGQPRSQRPARERGDPLASARWLHGHRARGRRRQR